MAGPAPSSDAVWSQLQNLADEMEERTDIGPVGDARASTRLVAVYIHDLSIAGHVYVGYGFEADWEVEHGAGLLTHGDRIVTAGDMQRAMLFWVAEQDAVALDPTYVMQSQTIEEWRAARRGVIGRMFHALSKWLSGTG